MFSLIITIISIALVAVLALATIYYGGSAFNKGADQAKASQLINEGQQINGAAVLNAVDAAQGTATAAATLADLTTKGYLASAPVGWSADFTARVATSAAQTSAVCDAVNTKAAGNGLYTCDTATKVVSYKF